MSAEGEKQTINTLSVGQVAQFCDRSTQWVQQLANANCSSHGTVEGVSGLLEKI